jgi:hypothetical protein
MTPSKKRSIFFSKPNVCQATSSLFGRKRLYVAQAKKTLKDNYSVVFGHPLCDTFLILESFFCTGAEFFCRKNLNGRNCSMGRGKYLVGKTQ